MHNKFTKSLSLILSLVMLIFILSGCMREEINISINDDNTGNIHALIGFSKEVYEMMNGMSTDNSEDGSSEDSDFYLKDIDGESWYVQEEDMPFSNLDELNDLLNGMSTDLDEYGVNNSSSANYYIERHPDGTFTLTITSASTDESTESELGSDLESDDSFDLDLDDFVDAESMDEMASGMLILIDFTFPSNHTIYSDYADYEGIKIDANTLHLDIMTLSQTLQEYPDVQEITFNTEIGDIITTSDELFKDVLKGAWYYDAVTTMAKLDVVHGYGGGLFGPEDNITYAQFCQLLSNRLNITLDKNSDYWAYPAIKYCLGNGYIEDLGEIITSNYDVEMSRQAAIAAMVRANVLGEIDGDRDWSASDIPDFDEISSNYQSDIIKAYQYNITHGMDSDNTFSPLSSLTRAQVCQLFYNVLSD